MQGPVCRFVDITAEAPSAGGADEGQRPERRERRGDEDDQRLGWPHGCTLRSQGVGATEIARQLNIGRSTVYKVLELNQTSQIEPEMG